ncbi:MAG: response regulator transcription factor [Saprospiraceae bacterium]|nr:response regulator transcription factor [Saprospiraceae bacterium]
MGLQNIRSKYQKYLLGMALVLSSIAISIRSRDGKVNLILQEYPFLIFLMIVASSFLVAIYFAITRRKISSLSDQIKEQSKNRNKEIDALLDGLTERQREVFDLIIAGKTNKEIKTELFIEQSTLKTHINQIYKKLNIRSRSELKAKLKP